jgi:hypothetical protein
MQPTKNTYSSCCGIKFEDTSKMVCSGCQTEFWVNPVPVVLVLQPVLFDDGRVGLTLNRRGEVVHATGGIALPGGYMEIESCNEAGAREWEEEGMGTLDPNSLKPFAELPYESVSEGRQLLIFLEAPAVSFDELPEFIPNPEATERVIVFETEGMCFPAHVKAGDLFFARYNQD